MTRRGYRVSGQPRRLRLGEMHVANLMWTVKDDGVVAIQPLELLLQGQLLLGRQQSLHQQHFWDEEDCIAALHQFVPHRGNIVALAVKVGLGNS